MYKVSFTCFLVTMTHALLDGALDKKASMLRWALKHERVFLEKWDPLDFADECLTERYRFWGAGFWYFCRLQCPGIQHWTAWSHAPTVLCWGEVLVWWTTPWAISMRLAAKISTDNKICQQTPFLFSSSCTLCFFNQTWKIYKMDTLKKD